MCGRRSSSPDIDEAAFGRLYYCFNTFMFGREDVRFVFYSGMPRPDLGRTVPID